MTLSGRLTRPDEQAWPSRLLARNTSVFCQEDSGPEERVRLEGRPNVAFTFSLGEISGLFLVKSIPTMPKSQAGI